MINYKKILIDDGKKLIFVIFLCWLSFLCSYYFLGVLVQTGSLENGFKLGADSHIYLQETRNIVDGNSSYLDTKSKFGYLIFLTPFLYFNIPLVWIVFFQTLLTGISAFALYKITLHYFCKLSAIICLILFLFYFPIQIWNFFILTETLFINTGILIVYFLTFFHKKFIPIILILLFFLFSLRPNGVLFLFSIFTCFFLYLFKEKKFGFIIIFFFGCLTIIFSLINFLDAYLNELNLIDDIINRGIIWGYSFENNKICTSNCLSLNFINEGFSNSLVDFFYFAKVNLFNLSKIFFYKIFWLIARVRPYYSDLHNLYLIIFNIILYPSFIYGIFYRPKNNFSINVIIIYILFSIILVGLTFADWDGRFSLYFFPFVMIFSSFGIANFLKKLDLLVQKK
jgi:hypothetical protein